MPKKQVLQGKVVPGKLSTLKERKTGIVKAQKAQKDFASAPNKFIQPEIAMRPITKARKRMIDETITALLECNDRRDLAAARLGLSERAIYKRFENYPTILDQVQAFHQQTVQLAKHRITSSSWNAADSVVNLMEKSDSERIRLDSAIEILDRSGIVKPQQNVQVNVLNDLRKDKDSFDI